MSKQVNDNQVFASTNECWSSRKFRRLLSGGEDNIGEVKKYVLKYWALSETAGSVLFWDARRKVVERKTYEKVKEATFPKSLIKPGGEFSVHDWFFYKFSEHFYDLVFQLDKPRIFQENNINCVNLFEGTRFSYDKTKDKLLVNDNFKEKLNFVLDHIRNIWCKQEDELSEFVINWIVKAVSLKKLNTYICVLGDQGTGKSVIVDMIRFCIGRKATFSSSSPKILLPDTFNGMLSGKVLMCMEEMPMHSAAIWNNVAEGIKNIVTNPTIVIEYKHKDQIEVDNCINLFIITNHTPGKIGDGDRRQVLLQTSNEKHGDYKYYEKLGNICKDAEFQELFYYWCNRMDRTVPDSFCHKNAPISDLKKDIICDNLESVASFLKEEFILKRAGLNIPYQRFYEQYAAWCNVNKKHPTAKNKTSSRLCNMGKSWVKRGTANQLRVKVSWEELFRHYHSRHWIGEIDYDTIYDQTETDEIAAELDSSATKQEIPKLSVDECKKIITKVQYELKCKELEKWAYQNAPGIDLVKHTQDHMEKMAYVDKLIESFSVDNNSDKHSERKLCKAAAKAIKPIVKEKYEENKKLYSKIHVNADKARDSDYEEEEVNYSVKASAHELCDDILDMFD